MRATLLLGLVCLVFGCSPASRPPVDGGGAVDCPEGKFSVPGSGVACTAWSVCPAGQFEAAAGSATEDRSCSGCATGTFSTAANAAACSAWANCAAGQRVAAAGTATTDRACSACAAGWYTSGPNQANCLHANACPAGTVQTAAATATAPAVCSACAVGTYCAGGAAVSVPCASGTWDHDGDPATACAALTTCVAGKFASTSGSAIEDRVCAPCASGTFSAAANAVACTPWTTCAAGTYQAGVVSATTDRTCLPCVGGFSSGTNAVTCASWLACGAGLFVADAGTSTVDRACAPCGAGTFNTATNASTCGAWASCVPGQYVSVEGTASANRVCTTCATGYTTATNAASCSPWTTCDAGTYASPPGTATADRGCAACASGTYSAGANQAACAPWTACVPGKYLSDAGTSTANSVCPACPVGQTTTTQNAAGCVPGYFVAGTVIGLSGTGLVLQNNLGDNLSISSSGGFVFSAPVTVGAPYSVTVLTQPTPAVGPCTVANGSGPGTGNVNNVVVSCGVVFRVMSEGNVAVPYAHAVLVGPTVTVQAIADSNGFVNVAFPGSERPFSMTVAAAGHEALSLVGLNSELPTEVFIAQTVATYTTATIQGGISGRASPTNDVNVDLYEGATVYTTAASYSTIYLVNSPHPLQVVALEVNSAGEAINWVASGLLSRSSSAQTFNVALPATPAPFLNTTFSIVPAASGLFTASAIAAMTTGGMAAHYVGSTSSMLGGGLSWVISGTTSALAGGSMSAKGVDGPLVPNRVLYGLNGPAIFLRIWVRDPFANPTNQVTAPVVTSVTSSGYALNSLSAQGAGVGFDTLEMQIAGYGSASGTTYWRIYTAPGAPLSIPQLPPLPAGISLASIGLTSGGLATGMPMLIRFAEPATRPWMLPAGTSSFPLYEVSAAGTLQTLTATWP